MYSIKTILSPTDFSEYSTSAFRLACSLARDYGGRVVVLHVAEPPLAVAGDGVLMLPPAFDLEPLRERLRQVRADESKVQIEHRLAEGDAAKEILREAAEGKCDLIVMATHGRTGLGRLLMGSVAEQVLRKASCPVLTVKTPMSQTSRAIKPTLEVGGSAIIAAKE